MGGDEQIDIEQLKKMNPWITDDIKVMMGRFYKEGIKSEFEKAEKGNITSFFEKEYFLFFLIFFNRSLASFSTFGRLVLFKK